MESKFQLQFDQIKDLLVKPNTGDTGGPANSQTEVEPVNTVTSPANTRSTTMKRPLVEPAASTSKEQEEEEEEDEAQKSSIATTLKAALGAGKKTKVLFSNVPNRILFGGQPLIGR